MILLTSLTAELQNLEPCVQLRYKIENPGNEGVRLLFATAQQVDLWAEDEGSNEVWRWSRGRRFSQAGTQLLLASGQSFEVVARWFSPPPGEYTFKGRLMSVGAEAEGFAGARLAVR